MEKRKEKSEWEYEVIETEDEITLKYKYKWFVVCIEHYKLDYIYFAYIENKYLEADEWWIEMCDENSKTQFYSLEEIKRVVEEFLHTLD
jgi:hypothetical protein